MCVCVCVCIYVCVCVCTNVSDRPRVGLMAEAEGTILNEEKLFGRGRGVFSPRQSNLYITI